MATKEAGGKETITAGMSRWAAGLSYAQLSQEAVYQAKRFLLDSVGCALGGYQQHDVKIALAVLDEIAGRGLATVPEPNASKPLVACSEKRPDHRHKLTQASHFHGVGRDPTDVMKVRSGIRLRRRLVDGQY